MQHRSHICFEHRSSHEPQCEQRSIRIGGAVDDDSCNLIVAQLLWLDATDPKKVMADLLNNQAYLTMLTH
jgi:ATP-dependent protease ClpP protease subunit